MAAVDDVLFPERPALDAIAPRRPNLFKQETWTALANDAAQHCHEWAFDAAEEREIRDDANQVLLALGITARFGGTVREDGLALWFGVTGSDVLIDPDRELVKLTACTETGTTLALHHAFVDPIQAQAIAMLGDTQGLGALTADLGWVRSYADGRRQIGVRWHDLPASTMRSWLLRHAYVEVPTVSGTVDMVRGRERVRFIGEEVWWQSEVLAR